MPDSERDRFFYVVLACVFIPAIAILSFLPEVDKRALHSNGRFHSVGHLLVFGFVAFIAGRTSRFRQTRLVLFAILLVLGFGIEVTEHLHYENAMEWVDVWTDSLGVVGGTLLAEISAPASR